MNLTNRPATAWFIRNLDAFILYILVLFAFKVIYMIDALSKLVPLHLYLGYAGACSILLLPLTIWRIRPIKLVAFAAFWVLIIMVWAAPWNPRKSFFREFRTIEPGMTASQVETIMQPYMLDTSRSTDSSTHVYKHSNDTSSDYGQDYGQVLFASGKVISTNEHWGD